MYSSARPDRVCCYASARNKTKHVDLVCRITATRHAVLCACVVGQTVPAVGRSYTANAMLLLEYCRPIIWKSWHFRCCIVLDETRSVNEGHQWSSVTVCMACERRTDGRSALRNDSKSLLCCEVPVMRSVRDDTQLVDNLFHWFAIKTTQTWVWHVHRACPGVLFTKGRKRWSVIVGVCLLFTKQNDRTSDATSVRE